MKTTFWIAWRYFISGKKAQFINIIALLSMGGVFVGTTALILILSVFNGLEGMIRSWHKTINPELKIIITNGKSFAINEAFLEKIRNTEGVAFVSEVIEDNAVAIYQDKQMIITIKGVSQNYLQVLDSLPQTIVQGDFLLEKRGKAYAIIGVGVQYTLGVNIHNPLATLELWYPRRLKKINFGNLNPESNFQQQVIMPAGVFVLEQQYDADYVFVPLAFAESLLEYKGRRTALELRVREGFSVGSVKNGLQKQLGADFQVLDREEQQASLLKAIQVEKLFVFITLSFILGVSSFNIFFSLMLLAIDKSKDLAVLYAMGADAAWVRTIFFWEGTFIAFVGGGLGLALGGAIGWLQQRYGLVKMGLANSLIDAYPIDFRVNDFIFTAVVIIGITLIASLTPARYATKIDPKKHLKA